MIAEEVLKKLAHPTDCRHDCDCIGNIAKELLATRAKLDALTEPALVPACGRCLRRTATAGERAHPEDCLCAGCAGKACFGHDTVGCVGDP